MLSVYFRPIGPLYKGRQASVPESGDNTANRVQENQIMSAVTAVKATGETDIVKLLGADADKLLSHVCKGIPKETVHLPVSLSYHSQGVKVSETASWVGLGFTLNAGGAK